MNPITRYSNWCYYDQLNGKDLENGERLAIEFPDGVVRDVYITVKCYGEEITEHGGCRSTIPHREAFAETEVWGVKVQIPIYGFKAKRK
jgi:hypothetical protein